MSTEKTKLADEAIERLNHLMQGVKGKKYEAEFEIKDWKKLKSEVLNNRSPEDLDDEDKTLYDVAVFNEEKWIAAKEEVENAENKLRDLMHRAENSKQSFLVFDDTKYLVSKMNRDSALSDAGLSDPMKDLEAVRRIVFKAEAYKEIMS